MIKLLLQTTAFKDSLTDDGFRGKNLGDSTAVSREILPLTGIRFPITFAVLLLHFSPVGVLRPTGEGRVPLFFVLSGFVMAAAYFPHAGKEMTTLAFYQRRLARLYPLLIFTTLLAAYPVYFGQVLPSAHGGHIGPAFFRTMTMGLGVTFFPPAYLVPFQVALANPAAWFVLVELSAGLFFPMCLRALNRCNLPTLLLVTLLLPWLAFAWRTLTPGLPNIEIPKIGLLRIWASSLGSLPLIVFGACIYRLYHLAKEHGWSKPWIGPLATVLAGVNLVGMYTDLPWLEGGMGAVFSFYQFGATLLALSFGSGFAARIFSTAPLLYLGRRSYSIYMMTVPIYFLLQALFGPTHPLVIRASPIGLLLAVLMTIASGLIVYPLIEMPARQWLVNVFQRRSAKSASDRHLIPQLS